MNKLYFVNMPSRINKFLAEHGVASRRAVDEMIVHGRIAINGSRIEKPGYIVKEGDSISIDGKAVSAETRRARIYILLNKPAGCITTSKDTHGRKTIFDYVKVKERIFPVGRLDKDTTGVLLLTNDGELANALMHPRHGVEKVYRAELNKPFAVSDKKLFEKGILLDNKKTARCATRFFHNNKRDVIITLHEGRNRQIHRMFNILGYMVQKLNRISYAGMNAGQLKQGEWRYLSNKEINSLRECNSIGSATFIWKSSNQSLSTSGRMERTLK